jgi:predicted MFS family arabinose efflux permease
VVRLLRLDRVLLATVVAFGLFNLGMGMLRVTVPWLAHEQLPGGAQDLGLLLGVSSLANLAGSVVGGALRASDRQMRRIGMLQVLAGLSLLCLLVVSTPAVLLGLVLCNGLSAPMAVSSQVVRLARIPEHLRGRTMTLMRTVLNGTIPLGASLGAAFLSVGRYPAAVLVMVTIAAVPGVVVALAYRSTSFGAELGLAPAARTSPPGGGAHRRVPTG